MGDLCWRRTDRDPAAPLGREWDTLDVTNPMFRPGYNGPPGPPPVTENLSPLSRLTMHRWRLAGLVALIAIVAWVAYLQVNSGRSERSYSSGQVASFEYQASHDTQLQPLLRANRTKLVQTAEGACTYRLDNHSEAQTVNHLEVASGVPVGLAPSLAIDAENIFCAEVL